MTLTIQEISDLAKFAGLVVGEFEAGDDTEHEITIEDCPPGGVDNDGEIIHCKHIAFYADGPWDGCVTLGPINTDKEVVK